MTSSSMFYNANQVTVTGGTFTHVAAGAAKESHWKGLRLLQHKIAPGAFHNSAERYDPPKCHPHTRRALLKKIMDWVTDVNKASPFMWIYGPAGAGKSAIAQTMADICYRAGILAASFFFCRSAAGRNTEAFLITTLVYQLTLSIPEIRQGVGKALEEDPLIFSRSIEAQIKALVVNPLNNVAMDEQEGQSLIMRPRFIIIDGLDECTESKSQRYILDVLFRAAKEVTAPLFFLIASRPEIHIRDAFNEPFHNSFTLRIVLDDAYRPDADIKLFLESRFRDIKQKHSSLSQLQPPWPSEPDIARLVQKSSGQFIYASTVMKYIDSHYYWPPDRLNVIFGLSAPGDDIPFAELDAFYCHIFASVANIDKVMDILIFILMVQFWNKTKPLVEDFLFYRRGEVDIILSDLHSLVGVPPPGDESTELRIFHASLPDFLLDRSRSGKFFIDSGDAHMKLTRYCIKHLKLRRFLDGDPIQIHHLRSLFMEHCVESHPSLQLLKDLYDFDMQTHLEFWASEDNVIGVYEHDAKRIITLIMWFQDQRHPDYEADLFHHHLKAIDHWISRQLETYLPQSLFPEFLVAGTLTNFLSEEIFVVLGTDSVSNSGFTKSRRSDPLQIYSRNLEYANFYNILSQFLLNRDRCEKFFVDGRKYAALAMLFLDFLQPEHESGLEIERFAVHMLPSILSNSSKSEELAKELKTHQVQHVHEGDILHAEKSKAAQAIKKYLKRRDLPSLGMVLTNGVTTSASQKRPLPVVTRLMQSMLASLDIMSTDERLRVYARHTKSGEPSAHQFDRA